MIKLVETTCLMTSTFSLLFF